MANTVIRVPPRIRVRVKTNINTTTIVNYPDLDGGEFAKPITPEELF
jgi:hypothetical protein